MAWDEKPDRSMRADADQFRGKASRRIVREQPRARMFLGDE
jgi:hypothetical protein